MHARIPLDRVQRHAYLPDQHCLAVLQVAQLLRRLEDMTVRRDALQARCDAAVQAQSGPEPMEVDSGLERWPPREQRRSPPREQRRQADDASMRLLDLAAAAADLRQQNAQLQGQLAAARAALATAQSPQLPPPPPAAACTDGEQQTDAVELLQPGAAELAAAAVADLQVEISDLRRRLASSEALQAAATNLLEV